MPKNEIRCRFCSWKTPKWTRKKDGRPREGYGSLLRHAEMEHPEEFKKVMMYLGEEIE